MRVSLAARIFHDDIAVARGTEEPFCQAISFFRRSHSASTTIGAKNATAARRVIATRI